MASYNLVNIAWINDLFDDGNDPFTESTMIND